MKRWMKILLGILLALTLLLTAFVYALPPLVRHYGGGWLKEQTGRTLVLGDLSLNLLTWTLELRDVALSEPRSEERFAAFDRLTLQLSPKSLFEKAVIVTRFELIGPKVQVLRDGERFNFSDFMSGEAAPPDPPQEPGEPLLFSLNNLQIVDGDFLYVESRDDVELQRHRVRDFDLAVPFIGNTPFLLEKYVTPALHAVVNDAPLDVGGRLKLFTDAVEMTVDIDLNKVDIPFYLRLLPQPLPVRVDSGTLDSRVEVVYRASKSESPQLQVAGDLTLSSLRAGVPEGADLISLPYVAVRIAPSQVLGRELHLERVHLYNAEVWLNRDQAGQWSFAGLLTPPTEPAPKADPVAVKAQAEPSKPFLANLDSFLLKNGRVEFRDELPHGGFQTEVRELSLELHGFSTAPQSRAEYALALQTGRDERLTVSGGLTPEPLAVEARLDLAGVPLADYYPYLADLLTAPVSGLAGVRGTVAFADGVVGLNSGELDLSNVVVPFGGDEGVKLSRLNVAGVAFDGGKNRLEIGRVELVDGDLAMTRSAEGRLSFQNLLREQPAAEAEPRSAPTKEEKAFHYRLVELSGKGLQVAFLDQGPKKPVRHKLKDVELSLKNLAGPEAVAAPFRLQAGYGRSGKLDLSGEVTAATGKLVLDSKLQRISLPDFAPYLPETVRLILADGELDTRLKLRLNPAAEGLRGDFSGELGIRNFYCLDSEHREELLRWGSLQLTGIRGEVNPFALHLDGIALSDYAAKILIDEESQLNLQKVVASAEEDAEAPVPIAEEQVVSGPRPAISIDAITLQGGTVSFADRHLQPPFATTMYQLGGHIGRISSSGGEAAEVDLRGHLENLSPLQISGQINPLAERLFADIKISFKDIELAAVTPYTGTYLGYAVEKGKLFLDLEYRIDDKELSAQNRVLLDQFTFGEAVESEQAVSLPVKLAVSLLKDRSGAIRLDIPVAGRTDDPEFSVWSVVLTVLKNLLVKAATSPLSLLQAAFGGGEDFNAVVFPFGTAELLSAEKDKLGKLAEMLLDRPALRMEISGFADLQQDPEAYRLARLQQQLRKEKFLELVDKKKNLPGQTEETVVVEPTEAERYLEKVYDRADFPKPRNFLGFDKGLPAAEMEKLILTNTPAGPEQMNALAQERATAVVSFLTGEKGLPMERLFLVRSDLQQGPKEKGASGNRVEFGVVAR